MALHPLPGRLPGRRPCPYLAFLGCYPVAFSEICCYHYNLEYWRCFIVSHNIPVSYYCQIYFASFYTSGFGTAICSGTYLIARRCHTHLLRLLVLKPHY